VSRFKGRWGALWPFWGFAAIGLALALWQGETYHNKTTGPIVGARVDDCDVHGGKGATVVTCTGHWTVAGRRQRGGIDGVDIPDMYKTVRGHLHGGTVYAQRRLVAPLVFFFVGLLMAAGFLVAAWRVAGKQARDGVARSA
jgi:hypothetical protein